MTDRSGYRLARDGDELRAEVPVRLANRRADRVFLPLCSMPALQWRNGDRWMDVPMSIPVCLALGSVPLEPGTERLVSGQVLLSPSRLDGSIGSSGDEYRLVFELHDERGVPGGQAAGLLPVEQRVTNSFRLTW
ncbi:MAG: hypothetical protein NW201_09205 [Gemmatimonadales bacterium]|nr:hypothetical protein [Gemmatimonadales bacterium]